MAGRPPSWLFGTTKSSPFRYFKTNPEIIRLAVMMYIRLPLWGLMPERTGSYAKG